MSSTEKMRCPQCGAEMNQHARKLNLSAVLTEPDAIDPELEGIVEEIHTCPECGRTASRRGLVLSFD